MIKNRWKSLAVGRNNEGQLGDGTTTNQPHPHADLVW